MHTSNNKPTSKPSQSRASIQIDELVRAIERTSGPAFHIATNSADHEQASPARLSKYLSDIQQLMDIYEDRYDYSEQLQIFRNACQDIGLERSPYGPICLDTTGCHYLSFAHSMNTLVARVRQLTNEPDYQRKAHDHRYQAQKNTEKLEDYIRAVMNKYSRTVVVRIDLHYLSIVDPLLRIEHLYADLATLLKTRERNPIFKHETGYAWTIEQGKDKGFHIHTAFFFNGAHVRSDWHKAVEIGELWFKITGGRGYIFNCNADKAKYGENLGIGIFNRTNSQSIDKVVKAVNYLTKDSQSPRIKPTRARTFGTGLL